MSTNQDINDQQELLQAHRQTLAVYLRQRATVGTAHVSPAIINGIRETRENIRRIKGILRGWDVSVMDHPDDNDTSGDTEYSALGTGGTSVHTGEQSINIGVGSLLNPNIHVGDVYDSSLFPYEFIEVRFFARADIQKEEIEVTRMLFFKGKAIRWPIQIEYDIVASVSGNFEREYILMKGKSNYVEYDYCNNYDNRTRRGFSIDDMLSGRAGWHHYYPVDMTPAQRNMIQFVNSLGNERWELITPPQSLGNLRGTLDVEISPPNKETWRFAGGEVRCYVGQNKSNPQGICYALKRSRPT